MKDSVFKMEISKDNYKKRIAVFTDNQKAFEIFIDATKKINADSYCFWYFQSNKNLVNGNDYGIHIRCINLNETSMELFVNFYMVLSVHSHQIFPPWLINNFRCINFHPGYLPTTRGVYSHVFAILHDLDCGFTVHEMTNKIDIGKILLREKIEINSNDDSYSLYNRLLDLEGRILEKHLIDILECKITPFVINSFEKSHYFSKADFKKLTKINLSQTVSFEYAIRLFRALSHNGYDNLYFIDKLESKIFLSLNLKKEEK